MRSVKLKNTLSYFVNHGSWTEYRVNCRVLLQFYTVMSRLVPGTHAGLKNAGLKLID